MKNMAMQKQRSMLRLRLGAYVFFLFLIGSWISCERSDPETALLNQQEFLFDGVDVINGMLRFKDYNYLSNFHEAYSNFTDEEIYAWEESIGFESFRRIFDKSSDEFFELNSEGDYENWKSKYKDILYVDDIEENVISRIPLYYYEIMANRSGEYMVGEELIKVLEDRTIRLLDGNRENLSRALTMDKSSEELKIHIMKHPSKTIMTRSNDNEECGIYYSKASMQKGSTRRVILEVVPLLVPAEFTQNYYNTQVTVRVHGYKKGPFGGMNTYKTKLAFDKVSFEVIDHNGVVQSKSNLAKTQNKTKRNLYVYYTNIGTETPYNEPMMDPEFIKVKGRAISRGVVSMGRWAVLCCNYSESSCPNPTAAPLDPF